VLGDLVDGRKPRIPLEVAHRGLAQLGAEMIRAARANFDVDVEVDSDDICE
jgi:hypothetical protein